MLLDNKILETLRTRLSLKFEHPRPINRATTA
jgi:hypothetical protein